MIGGGAADADEPLIRAAQGGDEQAFCALVREHQGVVRAFISRYAYERAMIDDIAQEAFLAAYRDLSRYDGRAPFRTWLLGIARHRALTWVRDEGRRRSREPLSVEAVLLTVQPHASEDFTVADQRLGALRTCVEQLPGHSANLINAHYRDGDDTTRLADRSGRSEGAVRMALMRVRRLLRECVERSLEQAHG